MKGLPSDFQLIDKAYRAIKSAIVTLNLKPGEQIIETRLAETLGISKTPIREALWRLYHEGFVEREPFRGAFVSRIRPKDVRDLFELREYLEPVAVRDATEDLTAQEIDEIEELVNKGQEAYDNGDYDEASRYIRLFHDRIIAKVRNDRVKEILMNLDDHLDRIRHISIRISGLPAKTFSEHTNLVQALRKRDKEEAERIMKEHIVTVLDAFLNDDAIDKLAWFTVGEGLGMRGVQ